MSKKEKFLESFIDCAPVTQITQTIAQEALTALQRLEIPSTKDEYWKYTRLGKIVNNKYTQGEPVKILSIDEFKLPFETNLLVFINGFYSVEFSDIKDDAIKVKPFADGLKDDAEVSMKHFANYADHNSQIFTALNTAYSTNGAFVYSAKNSKGVFPVHILNITTGENHSTNPRNLFVAEQGSEVTIINTFETISEIGRAHV